MRTELSLSPSLDKFFWKFEANLGLGKFLGCGGIRKFDSNLRFVGLFDIILCEKMSLECCNNFWYMKWANRTLVIQIIVKWLVVISKFKMYVVNYYELEWGPELLPLNNYSGNIIIAVVASISLCAAAAVNVPL